MRANFSQWLGKMLMASGENRYATPVEIRRSANNTDPDVLVLLPVFGVASTCTELDDAQAYTP